MAPSHTFLISFLLQLLSLIAVALQSAHPAYDDSLFCEAELADISFKPAEVEEFPNGRIIDITHAYRADMPKFMSADGIGNVAQLHVSMANGSLYNESELKINVHTGTHVDAPGHMYQEYYEAGFDIDNLDLEVLNGKVES